MPNKVITIDGVPATGKTTLGKLLAKALDFYYIDSGGIYRAIAFSCMRKNIGANNPDEILELLTGINIEFDNQHMFVNGINITSDIRSPKVSKVVTPIAAIPKVREFARDIQHKTAELGNVIADGRDVGTVVFPKADLKFYLTASLEARAHRRFVDLYLKNPEITIESVTKDLWEREAAEKEKKISKVPKGAVTLDTSNQGIVENFSFMYDKIKEIL